MEGKKEEKHTANRSFKAGSGAQFTFNFNFVGASGDAGSTGPSAVQPATSVGGGAGGRMGGPSFCFNFNIPASMATQFMSNFANQVEQMTGGELPGAVFKPPASESHKAAEPSKQFVTTNSPQPSASNVASTARPWDTQGIKPVDPPGWLKAAQEGGGQVGKPTAASFHDSPHVLETNILSQEGATVAPAASSAPMMFGNMPKRSFASAAPLPSSPTVAKGLSFGSSQPAATLSFGAPASSSTAQDSTAAPAGGFGMSKPMASFGTGGFSFGSQAAPSMSATTVATPPATAAASSAAPSFEFAQGSSFGALKTTPNVSSASATTTATATPAATPASASAETTAPAPAKAAPAAASARPWETQGIKTVEPPAWAKEAMGGSSSTTEAKPATSAPAIGGFSFGSLVPKEPAAQPSPAPVASTPSFSAASTSSFSMPAFSAASFGSPATAGFKLGGAAGTSAAPTFGLKPQFGAPAEEQASQPKPATSIPSGSPAPKDSLAALSASDLPALPDDDDDEDNESQDDDDALDLVSNLGEIGIEPHKPAAAPAKAFGFGAPPTTSGSSSSADSTASKTTFGSLGGTSAAPSFGSASFGFGSSSAAAPSMSSSSSSSSSTSSFGFGSAAPTFGSSAPAFGATSTFGSSTPAFGSTSAPSFGSSAPAFGSSAPSFGSSAPSFGSSAPSFGSSAPSFGSSAPSFGSSAPSFGSSAPSFGSSAPSFGSSAPSFGSSAPSFGSSAPAFGSAAPAFGSSAPTFGAPSSGAGFGPSSGASFGFGASAPAFGSQSQASFAFGGQAAAPASQAPAFGAPSSVGGAAFGSTATAIPQQTGFAPIQFGQSQPLGGGAKPVAFGGLGGGNAPFGSPGGFGAAAFGQGVGGGMASFTAAVAQQSPPAQQPAFGGANFAPAPSLSPGDPRMQRRA